MSALDHLTVLTTVDGKFATKRISRTRDGEWSVTPYGNARWFSIRQIAVDSIVSLGQALKSLERDPDEHDCWLSGRAAGRASRSFVVRGGPFAGHQSRPHPTASA